MRAQMLKVVRLAKEFGQVGRDGVDKAFQLGAVGGEELAILLKGMQAERAQAARQAAVHQVALAFRQRNAGMLVGELHQ
jgi:GGDEF domain-containing protein